MKNPVRFLLFVSLITFCGGLIYGFYKNHHKAYTDTYVRSHVVMLLNPAGGSCTGFDIETPTHQVLTMSAAHCSKLRDKDNMVVARDEDEIETLIRVVQVDPTHDLMLLESRATEGLKLAPRVSKHQHVHVIAHGGGMPSFRTDGEVLVPIFMTIDFQCILYASPDCIGPVAQTVTSTPVIPGASGGPLLDDNNNVVGVVQAIRGDGISYFGSLVDIEEILKGK